jgi:dienelactone hydrolase
MINGKSIAPAAMAAVMVMGITSCNQTVDTAVTASESQTTEETVKAFTPVEITEEYDGSLLGISDWHIETEDLSWGGVQVANVWFIDDATGKDFAVYGGPTDSISAYLADLNGDGEPELVCTGAWGTESDFNNCTSVYRLNGGAIEIAYPCYGNLNNPSYSETYPTVAKKLGIDINSGNFRDYSDRFDPVTNTIRLSNVDGTEYEIAYDFLEFCQYIASKSGETTQTKELASDDIDITYETSDPVLTDISATEKSVTFYRDGMEIEGKLYLPEGDGTFPVIVLSCGLMQPYADYAEDARGFAANGYAAVVFSFIGYSDPDGEQSADDGKAFLSETADLYAVLDSLNKLPKVDSSDVYLWGHSFGGLVSAFAGCERSDELKGLLLVEPSLPIGEMLTVTYEDGTNETLCIYDLLKDCKLNTVIYMGTHDGYGEDPASFDKVLEVLENGQLVIIDGADHFFKGEYGQQMVEDACEKIASVN